VGRKSVIGSKSQRFAIENLYDPRSGGYSRKSVAVQDGRVVRDDEAKGDTHDVAASEVSGYVLPGLIDAHVHICLPTEQPEMFVWRDSLEGEIALYAARAAERTLKGGIITARELGGWNYHEIAVQRAIERGEFVGPRLQCCGKLVSQTTSTHYTPGMRATAVEDCRPGIAPTPTPTAIPAAIQRRVSS